VGCGGDKDTLEEIEPLEVENLQYNYEGESNDKSTNSDKISPSIKGPTSVPVIKGPSSPPPSR
jgi:hypothetical protein